MMLSLADWMLFAAVLVFLLTIAPFKPLGYREFDNAKPRDPAFWAKPIRSRAQAAHQNGIETFPFFAAAVLLAEIRHAPQGWIDGLAVAFIAFRLAFVWAYLADRPWTRTALWNLGFLANLGIFLSPIVSP